MSQEATRIEALRLVNYRRFEDLLVDFDPELTVLVAANGGGKTALLDALVAVWGPFVDALQARDHAESFSEEDVRRVLGPERTMETVLPARVMATGLLMGQRADWGKQVDSLGPPPKTTRLGTDIENTTAAALRDAVIRHAAGGASVSPVLPLICSHGTGRLWSPRRPARTRRSAPAKKVVPRLDELVGTSRFSAYTDGLSPASSFRSLEIWFRRFSYEAQSEISSGRRSPHNPRERLAGVRSAVDRLLAPSGWHEIEWDFAEDTLVASHPAHGRLPVRLLSDGIRNMIGLIGDMAHRCVRLNPHLGADAPSRTPGIVLIDEVDMHLHPAWQQTVVPSLREAFPAMQLIVTTHSHLVVSTVPGRCIRILASDGSVSTPGVETQGYESPFALGVVFGVDSTPPVEIARQLTRYRALLELGQGDSEEAEALRRRLLDHFGAGHPAILEADGLRRLHQLKARIGGTRGAG